MNKTQWHYLIAFSICLFLACGVLWVARDQDRIQALYGDAPQTISVADLSAQGFGDNIWVTLTNVQVGEEYVIESRDGKMGAVWVPAFPLGQADATKEIKVVLRTAKVTDEKQLQERFAAATAFQGSVLNPLLHTPYDAYRQLLAERYPDHKLADQIWIIDLDDDDGPPSAHWGVGLHTAAIGLGTTGFICCLAFVGEVARRGRETPPQVPQIPTWSGNVWR